MTTTYRLFSLLFWLSIAGCANGDPLDQGSDDTAGGGDDASVPSDDATTDASTQSDSPASSDTAPACDPTHTGADCGSCASGYHACGAQCVTPKPNMPEAGCAMGCGTACPTPQNGIATCNDAGICDIGCLSGQIIDGGCGCAPGTRLCGDGQCHACCTNTDCPSNTACTAQHTCGGCVANFGDCDGNPANGCETNFSDKHNCGQCGNSCCGSFCGCGIFGVQGEHCRLEGAGYVCDC